MNKFLININGKITSGENAMISVLDRGFLYGDSVYEATRTFNKKPLRLSLHIDRLFESANKIYFTPKLSKEEIISAVNETIKASPFIDSSLRIVLTRGNNCDLGLDPDLSEKENLVIYCKELKANPEWWYTSGVKLTTYQKETSSIGSLPKTGNYIENMLAYRKALKSNFYDSIMINNNGYVTECTTSNIWIVKNGLITTPALIEGVLPGLTRATIISMSSKSSRVISEARLSISDILSADECFITSTTREIVPVTMIDQHQIGPGTPGKITLLLMKEYREEILKDLNSIS